MVNGVPGFLSVVHNVEMKSTVKVDDEPVHVHNMVGVLITTLLGQLKGLKLAVARFREKPQESC